MIKTSKFYEDLTNHRLLPKVPVIINLSGRSFARATAGLAKPHCDPLALALGALMIRLAHEADGATFLHGFSDQISILLKNDQTKSTIPWCDNNIQKIVSSIAGIASAEFNQICSLSGVELNNIVSFSASVFCLPTLEETISFFIERQQLAFVNAVDSLIIYELGKKFDKSYISSVLKEQSIEEKIEILSDECDIQTASYPLGFRRGIACYRTPKLIETSSGNDIIKNKWTIDASLPSFAKDGRFLENILQTGKDIFRPDLT